MATGDSEGEARADSSITLTGDVPNSIMLSETTEVADAAVDEFPGAMADELPGVMRRHAADAATGKLPDTTTDEFPGASLREAQGSSKRASPQGSTLSEKGSLVFLSIGSVTT